MTRSRAKDKKATSPPKKAAKASPKKAAKASPVAKKAGKIAKAVEFVAKKIAPKKAPPAKKASPAKAKSPPKKPSKSPASKKTPEPKKAKPVSSPVKAEMTPRASGRQRKVMDYSAMAKGTPQDPLKAATPAAKRKSEVVQTAKTPIKRTKREESPKKEKPVVVEKAAESLKKAPPAKAPTSPKKVPDSPKKAVAAKKVEQQSPRKAPETKKKPEPKVQESPKKAAAASPKKAESKVKVEVPSKVQPSPKKVPESPKNTAESKKKPEAKVIEVPAKVVESPKKEPLTKVIEIPAKVIQSPKKGSTSPTRASMRSASPKKVIEVTDEFITNADASEQKIVSVEPMTQVIVIEKSDDSESHTDVIKVQLAPHEKIIQINNGIPIEEAGNGIPIERCHDCPGCLRKPCNECSFCKNGQKLLCIDRYCMNTDEGRKQREDAKAKYLESLSKAKLDSEQLFEPDRNLTIQEQVDMIMNQLQFKQKSRPPSDVRARLISTPRTPNKTPIKSPGDPKEKKVRAKHKMVAVYGSSERASKSRRCGECEGCMRDDCGTCAACRDKPRFGGKGSKKKACIARSCRMRGPPAQGQALVVAPTQGEGENTAYQIVVMKQDD